MRITKPGPGPENRGRNTQARELQSQYEYLVSVADRRSRCAAFLAAATAIAFYARSARNIIRDTRGGDGCPSLHNNKQEM